MRRVPAYVQSGATDCGLVAVAIVATAFGVGVTPRQLRRIGGDSAALPTLNAVLDLSRRLGLAARPLRVSCSELGKLRLPAILHWELDHFVVLVRVRRGSVTIHDPAIGRRRLAGDRLRASFTGVAVEYAPVDARHRRRLAESPSVLGLVASVPGLGRYFMAILALMFAVQVLAVAPAIATQLIVDAIPAAAGTGWLPRTVAGIALVMMTGVVLDAMRRRYSLYAGTRLTLDAGAMLVDHLLRLPPASIAGRHAGDLLSRTASLGPIRNVLTDTLTKLVLQFVLVAVTLSVMLFYDPWLALLSAASLSLIAASHAAMLPRLRELNLEGVVAAARASSSLIETLERYPAVDWLGLAPNRQSQWQKHQADAVESGAASARMVINGGVLQGLVASIDYALFLGVGVSGVIRGDLTLGVLFAFVSLRGRLAMALTELVVAGRDVYLVRPHIERVAELLHEEPAPASPEPAVRQRLSGAIRCRRVGFRYSGGEPVVERFDCDVAAGERVVISGASGSGKSTVLALLAGRHRPTRGTIEIDGYDVAAWDGGTLRDQLGIVMQGDRLFGGSIADNIAAFDADADIGRIRRAAELACVRDVIECLPMRFHTPLINGGGLSAGQAQRLLLARALYRQPRLLLLDEATAHLDAAVESRVLDNLLGLGITIVAADHGDELRSRFDRVIRLRAR